MRGVKVGDRVQMGQKIGEVGNSGGSFGAHLHHEQLLGSSPTRVRPGNTAVRCLRDPRLPQPQQL